MSEQENLDAIGQLIMSHGRARQRSLNDHANSVQDIIQEVETPLVDKEAQHLHVGHTAYPARRSIKVTDLRTRPAPIQGLLPIVTSASPIFLYSGGKRNGNGGNLPPHLCKARRP
ncbi:hypothetical protein M408DRAFT_19089 [Serendipita vermifera MAFF 305830]|uniref:Uncharacterized protein n=1 Tax=Serendipita vermifera MAFF 305830 TaxID=933852 RepID=A0A0C3BPZ7_SERVB|nr:hypothetical protein M408DRAFT_19089 [Serendipita vermifera MAFF 305830]